MFAYLSYQNLINEHWDSFLNVKVSQFNCILHSESLKFIMTDLLL